MARKVQQNPKILKTKEKQQQTNTSSKENSL